MKSLLPVLVTLFFTTSAQAGVYGGNPAPSVRTAPSVSVRPVLRGVYGGNPTVQVLAVVSHPRPANGR